MLPMSASTPIFSYVPIPVAPPAIVTAPKPNVFRYYQPMAPLYPPFPPALTYVRQQPVLEIPSEEQNKQLTLARATKQGLKSGLIFAGLGAFPIWLIEKITEPSLIEEAVRNLDPLILQLGWSKSSLSDKLQRPVYSFLASLCSTSFIGITGGAALGAWMISRIKKRLSAINQAKTEQQQGVFVPKSPNWLQKIGLAHPPIQDSNQAFQDLLKKDLDPSQAVKNGAITALLVKVIPSYLSLFGLHALFSLTKMQLPPFYKAVMEQTSQSISKVLFNPALLIKTAALPLMAGFIAKDLVPWTRSQLGIAPNASSNHS